MLIIKDSTIELNCLHPALGLALAATVSPLLEKHGSDTIVTSGSEQSARHRATSLHYAGQAVDIRRRDPSTLEPLYNAASVASSLKAFLSIDFDIVLEETHIHIEYQPKRRG